MSGIFRVLGVSLLFGISILKVTACLQYVIWCCRSSKLFRMQNNAEVWHSSNMQIQKQTCFTYLPTMSLCSFSVCLSLFLAPACFSLPSGSLMSYQHQTSRRKSSSPIIVKLHQTAAAGMCLALGYFAPVFWMSKSWRPFRGPVRLQNDWAPILLGSCRDHISLNEVKAREEIDIIKVYICIFLENDSVAQGNTLCRAEPKLLLPPFLPLLIRLIHQPQW